MRRFARSLSAFPLLALGACTLDDAGLGHETNPPPPATTTGGTSDCAPSSVQSCYSGPEDTAGHGECTGGLRTCTAEGVWGPCEGEVTPREEDCAAPADEDCDGQAPPCLLWGRTFADAGDGAVRAVSLGAEGELLIAGFVDGTVDLGGGEAQSHGTDLLIAHLDASGDYQSGQLYGDDSAQHALAAALHETGAVAVAGKFRGNLFGGTNQLSSTGSSDLFVAAFASDGNLAWARSFGSGGDEAVVSAAFAADGRIAIAGRVVGPTSIGAPLPYIGGSDAVVAVLSSAGVPLWARSFGDGDNQSAETVTVDAQGDVLVGGWFSGSIDFGDGPHTSAGYADAWIAKLSGADGSLLAARVFGDIDDQQVQAMSADALGGICVAGSFAKNIDFGHGPLGSAGDLDAFVVRVANTGDTIWARKFGGPGPDAALSVAAHPGGGCVVGGTFSETARFGEIQLESAGKKDAFVVGLDELGKVKFASRFGDASGDQLGWSVAVDSSGGIAFGGAFDGAIQVDERDERPSVGEHDGFVIRFGPAMMAR